MKISHSLIIGLTFAGLQFFFEDCNSSKEEKVDAITLNNNHVADSISSVQPIDAELQPWCTIQDYNFSKKIAVTGMVEVPPENRASVSAYFAGYVKRIGLLPGQSVNRGQVLFTLENPDYVRVQKEFLEAKAALMYSQKDFDRQTALLADSAISQKQFSKAEAEYRMVQVRYQSLRKQLELMNIDTNELNENNMQTTIVVLSPLHGTVTSVNVNKGMFLNPSDVAVTVVDPSHLHLELSIFERDKAFVKVGQAISFTLQNGSNQVYKAHVYLVNSFVDPIKRIITVHGHLVDESQTQSFTPGMLVDATIIVSDMERVALPKSAIFSQDGQWFAWVKSKGNTPGLVKQEAKLGIQSEDYVEILNPEAFKGLEIKCNSSSEN